MDRRRPPGMRDYRPAAGGGAAGRRDPAGAGHGLSTVIRGDRPADVGLTVRAAFGAGAGYYR